MTSIAALIPRIRYHRTGRVVAIRCATCRHWRKPRHFAATANRCHTCTHDQARTRVTNRAAARRR
ncbi:hypothetical protein [Jidongwangia harbinensis]|uniref:hypothetical protein n=1 Tax=Jidongwangia harbinensis TaxID=2878561 RepID=UPI001CD92429|nr:hypothetical protein [Jidongwangia harbinensis]MCA2219522.1 hypothetical protein [Jidongwangia harbinensis]